MEMQQYIDEKPGKPMDLVPGVRRCIATAPHYPIHPAAPALFEVNADGHVFGAPKDAYLKSGAGGSGIYVVPSLDPAIYTMAGNAGQLNPDLKPSPRNQFHDGPSGGDDSVRRLPEMVVAAVIP